MPITLTEPLYTVAEAARVLGLTLQTVRNHISEHRIKPLDLGTQRGCRMIAESELRRFERERRPVGNPTFVAKRKRGV